MEFIPNQPIIFEDVPDSFALPFLQNDTVSFQFKRDICQSAENVVCNPDFSLETDLITNGNFNSGLTGWDYSGSDWAIFAGKATAVSTTPLSQLSLALTSGKFYKIKFTISGILTAAAVNFGGLGLIKTLVADGTYEIYPPAYISGDSDALRFLISEDGIQLDNISVYDVCWEIEDFEDGRFDINTGLCKTDNTVSSTASQNTLSATNTNYIITITLSNYVSGSITLNIGDASISGIAGNGVFTFVSENN